VHTRVMASDDVEAVGGLHAFVAVAGDGDHAAAVHRRVQHRQHAGWDEGGVVDQQRPAFTHRHHEGAIEELVAAVRGRQEPAEEVVDQRVFGAGDGEQVAERGLDQGGLAGSRRPVQQHRDLLVPQPAQHVDVGGSGQPAGEVQLAIGPAYRLPPARPCPAGPCGAGRRRREGTSGVDTGLGDLEAVRPGVVGGVPGGGHPLQSFEHRTGRGGADRPGDVADLQQVVAVAGEIQRHLPVQLPGAAAPLGCRTRAAGRRGGCGRGRRRGRAGGGGVGPGRTRVWVRGWVHRMVLLTGQARAPVSGCAGGEGHTAETGGCAAAPYMGRERTTRGVKREFGHGDRMRRSCVRAAAAPLPDVRDAAGGRRYAASR